jgi:Cu-processing system permease protein
MKSVDLKSIYYLAKKEFLDNIRNKWVIILTTLLFLLVILFSYLAGAGSGLGDTQDTVVGLIGISSLIIPLIAIILGFSAISGEAESGSFSVVLSYPVTRLEVLLGKFLGLGSVIITSVLIGFGIGGIVIIAVSGSNSWLGYFLFVCITILLGLIYLSLSICISSIFKRRITSIGGGLIIFFWGTIIGSVFLGILYSSGYDLSNLISGQMPDWYWTESFFSPADLNQVAVMKGFGLSEISSMGFAANLPDFFNAGTIILADMIWLIIPLILAYFIFKRRDI